MIGRIVWKSPADPLKKMGGKILICAAALGDLNSIVIVLNKALQNDEIHIPDLLIPMTKLQFYANQGNAEAMVMYGRILDHQRKPAEAAEMFRKVAETPRDVSIDAEIGNSLVQQGNMCYRDGKKEEARAYFKKAALEFDNPEGYFKFALLIPDEDSLKETYLLKAASSRVNGAAVEVARLYTRMADLHASSEKGQHARILANEWLKLVYYTKDLDEAK
jgi:tetratricopeptide (TPR) repeat protein